MKQPDKAFLCDSSLKGDYRTEKKKVKNVKLKKTSVKRYCICEFNKKTGKLSGLAHKMVLFTNSTTKFLETR